MTHCQCWHPEAEFYFCLPFFLLVLPSFFLSFPHSIFSSSFILCSFPCTFSSFLFTLFYSFAPYSFSFIRFLFPSVMNFVLLPFLSFPLHCRTFLPPFPLLDGPSPTLIFLFLFLFFFISCVRGRRRFWRAAWTQWGRRQATDLNCDDS